MSSVIDPDSIRNDTDSKTLHRHIMLRKRDPDFVILMGAMATACKLISRSVRKAGIAGLYGAAGSENATGDSQKKLDVLSNEMMVNALYHSHVCAVLVSEENEEPLIVPEALAGKYCVAFDPLDGSSNIDCNVSTGTIFSVWEKEDDSPPKVEDILKPGREMVCAGYCCYGSATELVLYYGHTVERYTLDPSLGEFILSAPDLKIPENPKTIYSINDGNYLTWDENMQRAVDGFKLDAKPYTARYVGSMVSDVHRTLLYGGVYLYPADKKKGNGKLRVLYEGFPMALIIEKAGGEASTGIFRGEIKPILDLQPTEIHDKCPVIIGCSRDVQRVLSYYK
jgi:fructose-1,6-bisphosphatase I